jgi:hypothetical protein
MNPYGHIVHQRIIIISVQKSLESLGDGCEADS